MYISLLFSKRGAGSLPLIWIRFSLGKSKIPDRMRVRWDRRVTGTAVPLESTGNRHHSCRSQKIVDTNRSPVTVSPWNLYTTSMHNILNTAISTKWSTWLFKYMPGQIQFTRSRSGYHGWATTGRWFSAVVITGNYRKLPLPVNYQAVLPPETTGSFRLYGQIPPIIGKFRQL
jgi:hypothetical protein